MPKWTVPQQNAIDAKNSNILVNAAAGSGKTAVLVHRRRCRYTAPCHQAGSFDTDRSV